MFKLNPILQKDSFFIADLQLSMVLLMNDANYPWIILVPKKPNLKDLTDLEMNDQIILLEEINLIAKILKQEFHCDKLNIASLGNVVSQLHIHVIVRNISDQTFPKPVWGNALAKEYEAKNLQITIDKIRRHLNFNANINDEVLRKKIIYRAIHRGCKETDFLLGKFFEENIDKISSQDLKLCDEFLHEDDMQIYDWLLDKIKSPNKYHQIISNIRDFHKL
jgi:diadenosine tetraphosphate (Ap4A) HIT family hydrolase/succinate dehydrogenase flavin-adding protein (antitoxin of CptAB toxin-antitoxin module)